MIILAFQQAGGRKLFVADNEKESARFEGFIYRSYPHFIWY
jgi:hypothetical protein